MLKDGLYEKVINREMDTELAETDRLSETATIDSGESSKILAQYISTVIEKGLKSIEEKGGDVRAQIEVANEIVDTIADETGFEDLKSFAVAARAEQLLALFDKKNTIFAIDEKAKVTRPETSIARSSLFTGASHEPQMYSELKKEIVTADRIDMLVSFVKWSGLRLLIDELQEYTQRGGHLRVLTTSYMGATDVKAVEELGKLINTEIKISYDTDKTRLHAKAYVFHRESGYTTAYVGSSNMSNPALTSGLEWNTKITANDLPETIQKIEATMEYYWQQDEFIQYSEAERDHLERALRAEKYAERNDEGLFVLDIQPYSYQQMILDRLEAERTVRGHFRNLVVAATGTGKTVISALDYRNFCKKNPGMPCRLLFVAHREEILLQSMHTFQAVLKNQNFGEMFVGNYKPKSLDHLFISIQTFNSQAFAQNTQPDFYDFIIVDEFHHAASKSYQELLEYYTPQIFLGLTATPERMDGQSILPYFENRIAAEIRLPEAIDRKLLCPFQYFGVTDNVDLNTLKWSRGGYDKSELSNLYTLERKIAEKRANLIVQSLLRYVTDIDDVKGLGFCVSIEHAKFMCEYFNLHRIPSMYLTGASPEEERNNAKNRLEKGDVRFIFVVDIYNEGVDIPSVNTILFLRPTESLTVFLQQLGRGLRLAEGKECLTVLDYIGQANKKYRFEEKFKALLSTTTHSISREIKDGFISVPKGCYIQLEKKAAGYILENIRAAYGNVAGLVAKIATFEEDTGLPITLTNFLEYYHLEPSSLYKHASFSRLCVRADIADDFMEPEEDLFVKAFQRFSMIDSRRWIEFILHFLKNLSQFDFTTLDGLQKRMLRMLYVTIWGDAELTKGEEHINEKLRLLYTCPTLCKELEELLQYRFDRIDFVDEQIDLGFECPLDLYCSYTRDQLFVALDNLKPTTIREGVKWLPDKKTDVFLITLNKSEKDYSETTLYEDYSITDTLFHWQSQSTTAEQSSTGQRYIHHKEQGSRVLLFVREFKNDPNTGTASAYTYLGTANYVSHSGSRPMSITWKLDRPIPAKYLQKTNKLVVG